MSFGPYPHIFIRVHITFIHPFRQSPSSVSKPIIVSPTNDTSGPGLRALLFEIGPHEYFVHTIYGSSGLSTTVNITICHSYL